MYYFFMYFVTLLAFLTNLPVSCSSHHDAQIAVDLIIFTFDRPLQLYCLLEGIEKYVGNLDTVCVIGRASDTQFTRAYDEVAQRFPSVSYIWQASEPKKDFKPLVMKRLHESHATHVLFAVDDMVITDYVDLHECAHALEQTGAYTFHLRLGTNITYSYVLNILLTVPTITVLNTSIMTFYFNEGKSYWAYPNTVDMALYRKKEIIKTFQDIPFHSPNMLEARWNRKVNLATQGICFNHSKVANIPLNIVQQDWTNKNEQEYTPQELLALWHKGLKMDLSQFYAMDNTSCHIPYKPIFIARD